MKKILCLAAGLLALNVTTGLGQPSFATRLANAQMKEATTTAALTKFNLDFPGGTPKQLVAAIEKATGKQLNVIVSADEKSAQAVLPPIKVNEMDVVRLFKTLQANSIKHGARNDSEITASAGFFTLDDAPTDNSLWTFSAYEKSSALTLFSLDFPGGTPVQLVKAIEKAMGKPLNVVINKEDESVELPPLKMNNVYLPQLFNALETASRKTVAVANSGPYGGGSYSQCAIGYGFKTADSITDTAVWYFRVDKPVLPPVVSKQKVCQFYSLADYLEAGLTVDDVTTVIQNGWKMAGVEPAPELKYHKETKLLMAYGEPEKLSAINDVLKVLKPKDDLLSQMNRQIQKANLGATNSPTEKSGK